MYCNTSDSPELERELIVDFGSRHPTADLIPYAGKYVARLVHIGECMRALMTVGGGHAYELGVGKAPWRVWLPSVHEMQALFQHESTRFIGRADPSPPVKPGPSCAESWTATRSLRRRCDWLTTL